MQARIKRSPATDWFDVRLKRFFANPWVGGIGTLASVAGLLLAIYFYLEAKEFRRLGIFVDPAKAAIVKAGQTSRLATSYDGEQVLDDITAAQVTIWNYGKLSIRSENVLDHISLVVDKARVLEVAVRNVTRDVTGFVVRVNPKDAHRIDISWNILESGDGAVIQVIYAGNAAAEIMPRGIIEGQRKGVALLTKTDLDTINPLFFGFTHRTTAFLLGFGMIALVVYDRRIGDAKNRFGPKMFWGSLIAGLGSIAFGIFLLQHQVPIPPPLLP